MVNIDLIEAIENVRDNRARLRRAYILFDDCSPLTREQHIQICEFNVKNAERKLADCMILLQDGYDLALLPKQGISS